MALLASGGTDVYRPSGIVCACDILSEERPLWIQKQREMFAKV